MREGQLRICKRAGQASPRAPIPDAEVGAQLFTFDVFPEVIRDHNIVVAVRVLVKEVKLLGSTLRLLELTVNTETELGRVPLALLKVLRVARKDLAAGLVDGNCCCCHARSVVFRDAPDQAVHPFPAGVQGRRFCTALSEPCHVRLCLRPWSIHQVLLLTLQIAHPRALFHQGTCGLLQAEATILRRAHPDQKSHSSNLQVRFDNTLRLPVSQRPPGRPICRVPAQRNPRRAHRGPKIEPARTQPAHAADGIQEPQRRQEVLRRRAIYVVVCHGRLATTNERAVDRSFAAVELHAVELRLDVVSLGEHIGEHAEKPPRQFDIDHP